MVHNLETAHEFAAEAMPEADKVDLSTAVEASLAAVEAENKTYRWNELKLRSSETISMVTNTRDMCVDCDIKDSRIKSHLIEMWIKDTKFHLYCNTTKGGKPIYNKNWDPSLFFVWNGNNVHTTHNKYLWPIHLNEYIGMPRDNVDNFTTMVCKPSVDTDYKSFKRWENLEKIVWRDLSKFLLGRDSSSCITTDECIHFVSRLKKLRVFNDLLNLSQRFWKSYKMTPDDCGRLSLAIDLWKIDIGNRFDQIINVDWDVFEVEWPWKNKRYSSVKDFLKSL